MAEVKSRKRRREDGSDTGRTPPPPSHVVEELLRTIVIEDEDGRNFRISSHQSLEQERMERYSRRFPELNEGVVVGCTGRYEEDNEDEDRDGDDGNNGESQLIEHLVIISKQGKEAASQEGSASVDGYSARAHITDCKISYEEVSATQLVEYQFEETDEWFLGVTTRDSLESFRKTKFDAWKTQLLTTTCRATLRSLLGLGPITRLYDRFALPTPEAQAAHFETRDENGKKVYIPHCVKAIRVWNAGTRKYDATEAHLDGAPERKEEIESLWQSMLAQLRQAHGKKLIDELLEEGTKRIADATARIQASKDCDPTATKKDEESKE
mmetsp:Transcript_28526/g.39718  ORF Transcript_28526/g.39718 Transcript_28526/m.39718 type:complete len:325 (-) Transcript_28526:131-1105(-)